MSTIKIVGVWLILSLWAAVAQAGTHHHYYTDPQGTVLAKTDAQGNIIATYDYAPYGSAVASMNPAPNGPGYTGHVNDPESGLVYMQARYYDPDRGGFLSVDPVMPVAGNAFNFNRYIYANENPTLNIDPDGREIDRSDSEILRRQSMGCQHDPSCAYALDNKVTRWFAAAMRGIAAHKAIQADVQKALPNMEVKAEFNIDIFSKTFGRVDLMIRQDAFHPWSVFEIKPGSYTNSDYLMSRANNQLQGYVSALRESGQDAQVGRWSSFFPEYNNRAANFPTGIIYGGVNVGGSYVYASPNDDGIIYYYAGDPSSPLGPSKSNK